MSQFRDGSRNRGRPLINQPNIPFHRDLLQGRTLDIPIILKAGLPCEAGPFELAAGPEPEAALPAAGFDAVEPAAELALAALSAVDALDFSAMLLMHASGEA